MLRRSCESTEYEVPSPLEMPSGEVEAPADTPGQRVGCKQTKTLELDIAYVR